MTPSRNRHRDPPTAANYAPIFAEKLTEGSAEGRERRTAQISSRSDLGPISARSRSDLGAISARSRRLRALPQRELRAVDLPRRAVTLAT